MSSLMVEEVKDINRISLSIIEGVDELIEWDD